MHFHFYKFWKCTYLQYLSFIHLSYTPQAMAKSTQIVPKYEHDTDRLLKCYHIVGIVGSGTRRNRMFGTPSHCSNMLGTMWMLSNDMLCRHVTGFQT